MFAFLPTELKILFGLAFLGAFVFAIYEIWELFDLAKKLEKTGERMQQEEWEKKQMEKERTEALKTIAEYMKKQK